MKRLLRKRWFRITAVIVLAAGILLAIAIALTNRRGAEELQRELAAARAAGMPLTRAELDADLPPPGRNAALHGILHEWESALVHPMDPAAEKVLAVFAPFRKPSWEEAWRRPDKPRDHLSYRDRKLLKSAPPIAGPPLPDLPKGSAHFWLMPKSDGYGQDPVSFLAEFERRHGPLIERLQHDLTALPEVRRPLPAASPLASDVLHDRLVRRCAPIQSALALRAEAALQTGQPGLAADTIVLSLNLGTALGSRGPQGVSAMRDGLQAAIRPLKPGIARHQWRPQDLDRIAAALQAMDPRRAVQRDIAASVLMVSLWEQWKHDRHDFRNQAQLAIGSDDFRVLESEFVREGGGYLSPGGLFDWNAAEVLAITRECRALAIAPGPLLPWWTAGRRMEEDFYSMDRSRRGAKRYFLISQPTAAGALTSGARTCSVRDQTLAACALEKYYAEHRTYPAALPPGVPLDPLLDKPFHYRPDPEQGFLLYSPGPNGIDEGGKHILGKRCDDWTW